MYGLHPFVPKKAVISLAVTLIRVKKETSAISAPSPQQTTPDRSWTVNLHGTEQARSAYIEPL